MFCGVTGRFWFWFWYIDVGRVDNELIRLCLLMPIELDSGIPLVLVWPLLPPLVWPYEFPLFMTE